MSERPLITGTVACSAKVSTVFWEKTLRTTASTNWLNVRAKSGMDSLLPIGPSVALRKIDWPPRWAIAASKLTRVRKLGFSKTKPSNRPVSCRGRIPLPQSAFMRLALVSNSAISSLVQSIRSKKCRIADSRLSILVSCTSLSPEINLATESVSRRGWIEKNGLKNFASLF